MIKFRFSRSLSSTCRFATESFFWWYFFLQWKYLVQLPIVFRDRTTFSFLKKNIFLTFRCDFSLWIIFLLSWRLLFFSRLVKFKFNRGWGNLDDEWEVFTFLPRDVNLNVWNFHDVPFSSALRSSFRIFVRETKMERMFFVLYYCFELLARAWGKPRNIIMEMKTKRLILIYNKDLSFINENFKYIK